LELVTRQYVSVDDEVAVVVDDDDDDDEDEDEVSAASAGILFTGMNSVNMQNMQSMLIQKNNFLFIIRTSVGLFGY